ncbi:MAG TPA: hypothetical protein VII63_07835 [Caulobacteraceae bacterium]
MAPALAGQNIAMDCGEPKIDDVMRILAERRPEHGIFVVGVTGSVAAGKTTFAAALAQAMEIYPDRPRVEIVCTDGFLFANAVLEERNLMARKGFPKSYDTTALRCALEGIRRGPVAFPGYSHARYDVDPDLRRWVSPPDILLVEGLGLNRNRADGRSLLDVLIYLDADESDIEDWFTSRFLDYCAGARSDGDSFYARFNHLGPTEVRAFAASVWREINLANLRQHILPIRDYADIVVKKGGDH